MKKNKTKPKELPKDVKFATHNSNNEDDILLEILIANLINSGASYNSLIKLTEEIENKKDKEDMKIKITNITLDFIDLNPRYTSVLKENDDVNEFLDFLGVDFII